MLEQLIDLVEHEGAGRWALFTVEGRRLAAAIAPGLPVSLVAELSGAPVGPLSGPWGEAAAGQTVIAGDLAADRRWGPVRELALHHEIRACWSMPVCDARGRVLGSLAVCHPEPRLPTSVDLHLLSLASRLAATALEQQALARHASMLALHDSLTGLPNRLLLDDRLQQALAAARRHRTCVGVGFVDLDGFKRINDQLGHEVGDGLLKETARRLRAVVRNEDTVARIGGDEFVVVLTGLPHREAALAATEKLTRALAAPPASPVDPGPVAASVGLAVYPLDGEDARTLLTRADAAMYAAKRAGLDWCRWEPRAPVEAAVEERQ